MLRQSIACPVIATLRTASVIAEEVGLTEVGGRPFRVLPLASVCGMSEWRLCCVLSAQHYRRPCVRLVAVNAWVATVAGDLCGRCFVLSAQHYLSPL